MLADGAKIKVNPAHPTVAISVSEAVDVSSAEGAQVVRPAGATDSLAISFDFGTLVKRFYPTSLVHQLLYQQQLVKADAGKFDLSDIVHLGL